MSFLGNLSVGGAKPRVYLSVTPGIGLEMIQLDLTSNSVSSYAVRDLVYDEATRDIADYDAFKNNVQEMFEELGIDPKCEVVMSMPLVSFGLMQFPLLLPDSSITGGIQSEVEQAYIFRRAEPAIAWQDVPSATNAQGQGQGQGNESRQILYTAIQKSVISAMGDALASLGANLIGVENSLTSTLRALDFAGFTQTQMQPNTTWNLMIVNAAGYSIVTLSGKNIVDYYEEPLAVKSFEGDEIYNAINQSAQIALMSCPANYLFILSDTDQVSASLLASKLQSQSSVTVLENNSFKKQDSIIPVGLNVLPNYASKISLQAVGTALADSSDYPLHIQFPGTASAVGVEPTCTFNIGEKEITLTANAAMKLVGLCALVLLIPIMLISYVIIPKMMDVTQGKLDTVNADIKNIDSEIAKYKESQSASVFNLKKEVENGVKANRSKLMNYVAAGDAIPKTVWLTYFMTQGDGLVDLKGVSSNVEDVYVFFKNMRDSLLGTRLRLQKLEMVSSSVDDAVAGAANSGYSFEITNMSEDQLSALLNAVTQDGDENGDAKNDDKNNKNDKNDKKSQNKASNNNQPPQSGLLSQQPIQ